MSIDVQGILERAGADPNAPEGSQALALAQVAKAHAELAAQAQRYYSGGSRPDNATELRAALAQVGARSSKQRPRSDLSALENADLQEKFSATIPFTPNARCVGTYTITDAVCSVILRVAYLSSTEPAQFIPFDDVDLANKRIDEFKALDTVESVTIFNRAEKHQRTTAWEVSK